MLDDVGQRQGPAGGAVFASGTNWLNGPVAVGKYWHPIFVNGEKGVRIGGRECEIFAFHAKIGG